MSASARIEDLRKRYEENPRRFFAPLANEYRKSGDLAQAISLCELHLGEQPGTLNGHVVYGQALFDAGRFDDARVTFENALILDPENLIALRHLGDIARALGDNGQAHFWYTRLLDADPRNHEIRMLLADLPAAVPSPRVPTPQTSGTPARPMTPVAAEPSVRTPAVPTPAVVAAVYVPPAATPVAATAPVPSASAPTPVAPMPHVPTPVPAGHFFTPASTPVSPSPNVAPAGDGLMDLALDDAEGASDAAAASDDSGVDLMFPPLDLAPAAPPAAAETDEILFADVPTFSDQSASSPGTEAGFAGATFALVDEPDAPESDAPPPFVTETMAELYLQQGFRDEGLAVYRQLLAENPGDVSLLDRIRALEGNEYSSLAFEGTFEYAVEPADVSAEEPATRVEATPAAPTEPEAAVPERPGATSPVLDAAEVSRSARDFFAALAARRAIRRGPVITPAAPAPTAVDAAKATSTTSALTLDGLFGNSTVAANDEQLAVTLAAVSQGIDAPPAIKGRPTQPATSELSLDAVFRRSPPRPQASVVAEPDPIRFDQFFSSSVGAEHEPDQPQEDAARSQPRSTAELEQFQDWLQQLKKP